MSVEKWNRIVDFFQEEYSSKENSVQKLWENLFSDVEFFGYSKLLNEVDSQRIVKIGSKERTIPDIIIRDGKNNKDLFIIELKRSKLDIGKDQLFSYLKILKVDIGILIADKIYIYYYDYTKDDSEQSCVTIEFENNNTEGVRFLQLFSKENFDHSVIKDYITSNFLYAEQIAKIKKELSPEFLKQLAINYFSKKYDVVSVEKALSDFKISIFNTAKSKIKTEIDFNDSKDLDKTQIRLLCKQYGIYLPEKSNDFVKAKLNKSGIKKYWANPDISKIDSDLWLILEDPYKRELHIFFIPEKAIKKNQIETRPDKNYQIDLQIAYQDINFTDMRSQLAFRKWYRRSIQY